MYPVMTGDGMRPTDLWRSKAIPREVLHQLKGNLKVNYNRLALISKGDITMNVFGGTDINNRKFVFVGQS